MLQGQTPMPMMTPMPVAPSPVPIPMFTPVGHNTPLSQMSACAGFNPSVSNPPSKPTPSTSAAPWPSGPQSPGGSSSSSSDAGKGRGGDWGNPGDGNPSSQGGGSSSGHGRASIGIGSNVLGFMSEKDVYRSKDLSLIRLENLPATASEFRAWKNTFLTRVASIDNTGRDIILNWVIEAFEEGGDISDYADSGLLPRLDSHLGSLLMDSRHLKGELGMRFQSYAESCQMARRAPRGRAFLYMLAQHFRLDLNRGSNLTQQALLDLQLDGFTAKDLEKFVERIEYVLNAIPRSHQPNEVTRFTWLYSRVKRCKLLQRHIDRIRDASDTSHCRTWDWLMGKIKAVLIEVREDQNEESIRAEAGSTVAKGGSRWYR